MGKQLQPLNFAESIISDFDNFHFCITSDNVFNENNSLITRIFFEWEWNKYSGYGEIYLKNRKLDLEEFLCQTSKMVVDSKSIKKVSNGRDECTLYNDRELETIFNIIVNQKQK